MSEPFYTCCEDGMLSQVAPTDSSGLCPACNAREVVGHKTFIDPDGQYRHEPLHRNEAEAMLAAADAAKAKRAADMPTEEDATRALWSAYQRLKELGWRETCYGPTNKTVRVIEPGSSGIHQGSRHEPWPEKTWWLEDHGDLWPSNPCLFKPLGDDAVERSVVTR
jgi:hypothetical protein